MSIKELYRDDLNNHFEGYSLLETPIKSMTLVEFKNDANGEVKDSVKTLVVDDAYRILRERWVGTAGEIMFRITEEQKNALTEIVTDTTIIVDGKFECYNGNIWTLVSDGGFVSGWIERSVVEVEITDGTKEILESLTLFKNKTYIVEFSVAGLESQGAYRCGVIKQACVFREDDDAEIQGDIHSILEEYQDPSWSVDIEVSGADVNAIVTYNDDDDDVDDDTSKSINWKCSLRYMEHGGKRD